jgi:K+-transporting ATPase ATPase A chain
MMYMYDFMQILIFLIVLCLLAPLLGRYMNLVYRNQKHPLFFLRPLERGFYKIVGINEDEGMSGKTYALSVAAFSFFSLVILFAILSLQAWLPLNPQKLPNLKWDLALNTAASFVTNTNWQAYNGEVTLSYFSQMFGLAVQNFASAAVGMACVLVLIRSFFTSKEGDTPVRTGLGNFWVDMTRSILYILVPLALIVAVLLVSQGVVQNFSPYMQGTTLEGKDISIPVGPAASQIAIKQLGTNGGGFFGVNSAHPLENPTPFSNFIQVISILLIPAAFPFLFGRLLGRRKQGYMIFGVMLIMFVIGLGSSLAAEYTHGTMEGKETRFGIVNSVLWSVATTAASNGSVNAMHDSLSPLSGMVAMVNIMLGEIIFGGVGSGLYGILAFIVIAVFIAGLMVGRSPEYLGKKIESQEVKLAVLVIILPSLLILAFSSVAILLPDALASRTNMGPHGLSEILYAFSSGAGNNGSAFGGLNVNTVFYNVTLAFVMLVGRYGIIIPILAMAASFFKKQSIPVSEGTFPTDTILFGSLLMFVILIIGGLTFFPVLTLGPILEHFMLLHY